MDKLKDIVSLNKVLLPTVVASYLDYVTDSTEEEVRIKRQLRRDLVISSIVDDIDISENINDIKIPYDTMDIKPLGLSVYRKNILLNNSISSNTNDIHFLYKKTLSVIKSLCNKHKIEVESTYNGNKLEIDISKEVNEGFKLRKLLHKCISASNIIATEGRIGFGQILIATKEICTMLEQLKSTLFTFIIDNSCGNSIYIYRINGPTQVGLQLFYMEAPDEYQIKYEFGELGLHPHKQFIQLDVIV